ncbi:hypothetical protein BH11ACT8_BH11ACT8_20550 [soil metagenome]
MFLWFLLIVALLAGAWFFRVPLLAKILGQPQSRIERQLKSRKRP